MNSGSGPGARHGGIVRAVVTKCHHRVLDELPPPPAKLRCKTCHLTLSAEELGGGWCPECAETRGERNDDFEAVEAASSPTTRYRCDGCGLVIEASRSDR